jgi:hypothetical protein
MDLKAVGTKKKIWIAELEEWREKTYQSIKLYKERTKRWYDKQIKLGDKVLLFNSRIHLFGHCKFRIKWEGPYLVLYVWIMVQSPSSAKMGIHSTQMANALNYSLSQHPRILRKWMSSISSSYNYYIHRFAWPK